MGTSTWDDCTLKMSRRRCGWDSDLAQVSMGRGRYHNTPLQFSGSSMLPPHFAMNSVAVRAPTRP